MRMTENKNAGNLEIAGTNLVRQDIYSNLLLKILCHHNAGGDSGFSGNRDLCIVANMPRSYAKIPQPHLIVKPLTMSRPISIHIPHPCHEDWGAMQPNAQGRHCSLCQKTVVDFTGMSDKQILQQIQQAAGKSICARVMPHQTYRNLAVPNAPLIRNGWSGWRWLLAGAILTSDGMAIEHQINKTAQLTKSSVRSKDEVETVVLGGLAPLHNDVRIIPDTANFAQMGAPAYITTTECTSTVGELVVEPPPLPPPIDTVRSDSANIDSTYDHVLTGVIIAQDSRYIGEDSVETDTSALDTSATRSSTLATLKQFVTDTLSKFNLLPSSRISAPAIYPNPMSRGAAFTIAWPAEPVTGRYTIGLYNMEGILIQSREINIDAPSQSIQWSLPSGIPAGTYIVRGMQQGRTVVFSNKLVVE